MLQRPQHQVPQVYDGDSLGRPARREPARVPAPHLRSVGAEVDVVEPAAEAVDYPGLEGVVLGGANAVPRPGNQEVGKAGERPARARGWRAGCSAESG